MDSQGTLSTEALDEDLQIIRATVALLADEMHLHSERAGLALETTLVLLDIARTEFAQSIQPEPPPREAASRLHACWEHSTLS